MDANPAIDLLLAIKDNGERESLAAVLRSRPGIRVATYPSAKASLDTLRRARVDAVVCSSDIDDCPWDRFAAVLHSGRLGSASVPLYILCDRGQEPLIMSQADLSTSVLPRGSAVGTADDLIARIRTRVRPTVLIVEDEPNPAFLARCSLQKDFDVDTAVDAEQGLTLWRARRHDLILLDLMLPGMSGAEMQRLVLQEHPQQAIIVLTAHPTLDNHQNLILSGAVEFLSKPVSDHDLSSACTLAIRRVRTQLLSEELEANSQRLHSLSSRIHVANYSLRAGRTDQASMHLQRAIGQCDTEPTDDEWTTLLGETGISRR